MGLPGMIFLALTGIFFASVVFWLILLVVDALTVRKFITDAKVIDKRPPMQSAETFDGYRIESHIAYPSAYGTIVIEFQHKGKGVSTELRVSHETFDAVQEGSTVTICYTKGKFFRPYVLGAAKRLA